LNATHQQELLKLRTSYEAEKTKAINDQIEKLRAELEVAKAKAVDDAAAKLRTEFATEKSNLMNSSRITLDFFTQGTVAREVVTKLIDAGAVPVDSLQKRTHLVR
jgi:hypothetical protein